MLMTAIGFQGNCDEAITYYKEALGAEVKTISYFRDAPPDAGMERSLPPNFVMYSEVLLFGTPIVMTDGATKPLSDESFWMHLTFDTAEEVASAFRKLADGGTVIEAPAPQFWAASNAYVIDRFGVFWNILTNS
ncbi:MAG: VOC family protein [Oscillospiraceae bacterium]|nr:VOC family protein [Oscillospiraceae bacterium]